MIGSQVREVRRRYVADLRPHQHQDPIRAATWARPIVYLSLGTLLTSTPGLKRFITQTARTILSGLRAETTGDPHVYVERLPPQSL